MTPAQALTRIHHTLIHLEHQQATLGCHPIQGGPLTPMQRRQEIVWRLDHLLAGGPNMALLEAAGAHLLALILAADEAEMVDIAAGDETTSGVGSSDTERDGQRAALPTAPEPSPKKEAA